LYAYQITDIPVHPVSPDFPRHVDASARWLLNTCESLDGVLAAEGTGSLPDPDEPGTALCRAARSAILAWRQPSGTSLDRDITVKRFITTTGFLSAAALGLATYAPRRRAIDLQTVCAGLAEVTAYLTAAIQASVEDAPPRNVTEPAQPTTDGNEQPNDRDRQSAEPRQYRLTRELPYGQGPGFQRTPSPMHLTRMGCQSDVPLQRRRSAPRGLPPGQSEPG
jgi:hypothetical protein